MSGTKAEQARVNLSGEMYRKGERWWWKVRLPEEKRVRARSLRPPGDNAGTTSRRIAEGVALSLWEAAVGDHARAALQEDRLRRARHRAEAHGRRHAPLAVERFDDNDSADLLDGSSQVDFDLPGLPIGVDSSGGDAALFTIADGLLGGGQGTVDQAQCECCGCTDFFEEYLLPIDSGQRLCPRCLHAFQQKVSQLTGQRADRQTVKM